MRGWCTFAGVSFSEKYICRSQLMNLLWPRRITSTLDTEQRGRDQLFQGFSLSTLVKVWLCIITVQTGWMSLQRSASVSLTWRIVKWAPWCWGRWCSPRRWGSLVWRRPGSCRRTGTRPWSRSPRTRRCDRWPDPPPPGRAARRSATTHRETVSI